MTRRGMVKVLESQYKIGDVVTLKAAIIHPMDSGFTKDRHNGKIKPKFYVKKVEFLFNGAIFCSLDLEISTSTNPRFKIPMKITKAGTVVVRFVNSKEEVTEKSTMITPA